MADDEPGKYRSRPQPLDYRTPYASADQGFGCMSILQFGAGFVVGVVVIFMFTISVVLGSNRPQGFRAVSVITFLGATCAGIAFVALLVRRPRRAMPFLLGLLLAACVAGLLTGVCFSSMQGI